MKVTVFRQLLKASRALFFAFTCSVIFLISEAHSESFGSSFISYHNSKAGNPGQISQPSISDYAYHRFSSTDLEGTNFDFINATPGEEIIIAEIQGPAEIRHIWMTWRGEDLIGRYLTLEIYWDNAARPAIAVPLGDFFLQPHAQKSELISIPIVNTTHGNGHNCYFRMPFKKKAKFLLRNDGTKPGMVYYHIDYCTLPSSPEPLYYFHAKYNQEFPTDGWLGGQDTEREGSRLFYPTLRTKNLEPEGNYIILSTAGEGYYVGCMIAVHTRAAGWWGEGDDMIFIDGSSSPTLYGTGTEDYFGNAWGLKTKQTPLFGVISYDAHIRNGESGVYRFHLESPIRFLRSIKVTIEHGHNNSRTDDFCSIAYWYQKEAGNEFGYLPRTSEARITPLMRARADFLDTLKESCRLESEGNIHHAIRLMEDYVQRFEPYLEVAQTARLRIAFLNLISGNLEEAQQALSTIYKQSYNPKFLGLIRDLLYVLESPDNALLLIAGDDFYRAYIDGEEVCRGDLYDDFNHIRLRLKPGKHTLLIECKNILLFGGVCTELVTQGGVLLSDRGWLITSPPERIDEKWYLEPNRITGWKMCTEYYRPWEVLFSSHNLSFYAALGLQSKWLWTEKNYVSYDEYYLRCDFMFRGKLWRQKVRRVAGLFP